MSRKFVQTTLPDGTVAYINLDKIIAVYFRDSAEGGESEPTLTFIFEGETSLVVRGGEAVTLRFKVEAAD